MTVAELSPPTGEPITLALAKAHLRLETVDEDTLIEDLIRAAREHLEETTGLALMARSFRLYRDGWPEDGLIQIAKGPVQAIDAVTVYDAAGLPLELALTGAILDGRSRPARLLLPLRPEPGQALNGIEIDFTAGFGESAADVPDTLKRALLLHVAHLYEFRGAVLADMQPASVPAGYDRLIAPWRRLGL